MSGLAANGGVKAENLVWIFGTGRSGSTWLASMMAESSSESLRATHGRKFWNEPLVGQLVGQFYTEVPYRQLNRDDFVFANATREAWLEGIRFLVLNVARSRSPKATGEDYLIIKEPNGSLGAPLLMEALPESRMVFLVRDPRDVAASGLDRHRQGGVSHNKRIKDPRRQKAAARSRADNDPEAFVRGQAKKYLRNISLTKEAYDGHKGPKVMVKYEELRADTLGTMRRIYSTLGLLAKEGELARAVEKYAWENVPEEEKGQGKDQRKATPGGWREDLTPEQAKIVERVTAPLLEEFYPN